MGNAPDTILRDYWVSKVVLKVCGSLSCQDHHESLCGKGNVYDKSLKHEKQLLTNLLSWTKHTWKVMLNMLHAELCLCWLNESMIVKIFH